ncbi:MAG: response regulator [candidate division Zixibacteria bacterium]|nr:response regulator [candidate division Zixibacteria bacterium]
MQKASILFVDDDPNVLSGLRRMMHPLRDEYELLFANGGQEALDMMGQKPSDIVISDMRMPGMTGAELLHKIYDDYPGTIRFILSGHSDRELIMQSVGFAHQYLAKPCDPEILRNSINRSVALQSLLGNPHLQRCIAHIKSLPTPPLLYKALVAELQSEEVSVKSIGEIISRDIGMTAKLLQIVNSAFFGLPTRVEDTVRAVNLLGLDTVRALVLTVGIFEQSQVPPLLGMSVDSIYLHSLSVGTAAKILAKAIGLDQRQADEALMAGMMHDIGQLVCLIHLREELQEVLEATRQKRLALYRAEIEIIGVSHADIGAHLLSLWGLPTAIVEAVAFHHNPADHVYPNPSALTAVHLANAFMHQIANNDNIDRHLDIDYISKLGLADRLPGLRDKCVIE